MGKHTLIQEALNNAAALLAGKKVAAGFDGFIDSIVKVVNHKSENKGTVYFKTIAEFGQYITGKSGSGFSLESDEQVQKLGGNMPIMANALASLGAPVDCVGAFGVPHIAPAFDGMHSGCTLHSYTNPGFTNAMEFNDGKIMLAQMTDLNKSGWKTIKKAVGLKTLQSIFLDAQLICLVNWSELDHSNDIWKGLLDEVYAGYVENKRSKQFFFDLSDCSKRNPEAIREALKHIGQFSAFGHVALSLNRNEAGILYKLLIEDTLPDDLRVVGTSLYHYMNIDTLIIHTSRISLGWDKNGVYDNEPLFIAEPKISTGAGDNFNAGFCAGLMIGLDTQHALALANITANCYINSGKSADINELSAYISDFLVASL